MGFYYELFGNCCNLFGNYVKKFFYVITMAFTFSYLLNQDSVFLTTRILEGIDKKGIGLAVMNRAVRASNKWVAVNT